MFATQTAFVHNDVAIRYRHAAGTRKAAKIFRILRSTILPRRTHAASLVTHLGKRMKVITQKRLESAKERLAELLKQDGAAQTLTVQEWLDTAQYRPAQFASSLPALEIFQLLGFGDEMVQPEAVG